MRQLDLREAFRQSVELGTITGAGFETENRFRDRDRTLRQIESGRLQTIPILEPLTGRLCTAAFEQETERGR